MTKRLNREEAIQLKDREVREWLKTRPEWAAPHATLIHRSKYYEVTAEIWMSKGGFIPSYTASFSFTTEDQPMYSEQHRNISDAIRDVQAQAVEEYKARLAAATEDLFGG